MPDSGPCTITGTSVSSVWATAFLTARERGGEIAPMVLHVRGADAVRDLSIEESNVRSSLDAYVGCAGWTSVDTVASTIFPESRWLAVKGDRSALWNAYRRVYPRLKLIDARNKKGTYFGRLTEPCAAAPEGQLERLITMHHRHPGLVRMRLQATLFSINDYDGSARPGFPCMQQISLNTSGGQLSLNAFYASQQLLAKGYGNYLGLIHLGRFLAGEMGLEFHALNVFVGIAQVSGANTNSGEFKKLCLAAEACRASAGRAT